MHLALEFEDSFSLSSLLVQLRMASKLQHWPLESTGASGKDFLHQKKECEGFLPS
jgi:hypothetical protein